ncbi:MAG: beta-N-acetylhexosaminidase [Phycisphaerae bacterium]|nr:beta-N-acetylhexosaminidase [Phycisphaerae bacterium]
MNRAVFCAALLTAFSYTLPAAPAVCIIPQPVQLEMHQGSFEMTPKTVIAADAPLRPLVEQFQQMLQPALGYLPAAVSSADRTNGSCILLECLPELDSLGPEGYRLLVKPDRVVLQAPQQAGLFYGIQTLRQLLPSEIFSRQPVPDRRWTIPCVEITDYPRFKWRGLHLDVCRHFMPKEFVKKYIDLLAVHKMNTFHWHLTDDQGWRIEIKKYPKLTAIGAWRKETVIGKNTAAYDGQPYGGFFTHEDIREVVEYARQRHITVVPEIEMPGHCLAALAAYPELSCTGGPFEVRTSWGIEANVFCAGNDQVFQFLEDVLDEVLALFPSPYIHIGGDECPKERWKQCPKCQARMKAEGLNDEHQLQSWFIKRMERYLASRGRRLIGWDEILEGGLAPGAAVMSWRGEQGGIAAAKAGHEVVMAPNSYVYFDYYQADPKTEPLAIGGFVPLEKVYGYNPVPDVLSAEQQGFILGVQGQIWTEYIATGDYAEYMAYPRACALAEVAWTPPAQKEYEAFYQRLQEHLKRLKALQVNFRPLDPLRTIAGSWKSGQTGQTFAPLQWNVSTVLKEAGTYEVAFQYTGGAHRLDIQSVELLAGDTIVASDYHFGITGGRTQDNVYRLTVRQYDPTAAYVLRAVVRSDGGTDSNGYVYLTKK